MDGSSSNGAEGNSNGTQQSNEPSKTDVKENGLGMVTVDGVDYKRYGKLFFKSFVEYTLLIIINFDFLKMQYWESAYHIQFLITI